MTPVRALMKRFACKDITAACERHSANLEEDQEYTDVCTDRDKRYTLYTHLNKNMTSSNRGRPVLVGSRMNLLKLICNWPTPPDVLSL